MTDGAKALVIYPPVRADWLALREEEVLDPELPIIDPHHHLWERETSVYMIDDLAHDLGSGHRIVGTVYVQCRSMYREHGPADFAPVELERRALLAQLVEIEMKAMSDQ